MVPHAAADAASTRQIPKSTADSLLESLGWSEEGNDLDLSLFLDGAQVDVRSEDFTVQRKRAASFRRHLPMPKLAFGASLGRPNIKDVKDASANASPIIATPRGPVAGSLAPGHARRRSRALSLITSNKPLPDLSIVVDPSAAHYQDPDARMKLRAYLASPHKFDEAIEFGFPSIEEVQRSGNPSRLRSTSQHGGDSVDTGKLHRPSAESDKSSSCSDDASTAEPDSPRTPSTLGKQSPVKTFRISHEEGSAKLDYAQAPAASREMTLRMTLTRSDLRADDEQIYGWQRTGGGGRPQIRDESLSSMSLSREAYSKESIERQFAAMDQEELLAAHDDGKVKRFWNRVRRS